MAPMDIMQNIYTKSKVYILRNISNTERTNASREAANTQHKPNISNDHQSVPGAGGATCIGWPISGKFKVNNGKVTSAPRKTKSGLWKASKAVRPFCTRQPWKILQCVIFTFPLYILSTNQTPEMRFPTYTAKLFCMIGGTAQCPSIALWRFEGAGQQFDVQTPQYILTQSPSKKSEEKQHMLSILRKWCDFNWALQGIATSSTVYTV